MLYLYVINIQHCIVMATFNLVLHKPYISNFRDKNGNKKISSEPTRVYLSIIHDAKNTAKIKTEHTVIPTQWNFDKQVLKSQYTGSVQVNESLKLFVEKMRDHYNRLRNDFPEKKFNEITVDLKEFAKNDISPIYSDKNKPLLEVYDEYIRVKSKTRSYRTIQKYETLKAALEDFQEKKNYPLTFESMNLDFLNKFIDYLQTKPATGRMKTRAKGQQTGLLNDTVDKYVSNIKDFLRWSYDMGKHQSTHFMKNSFRFERDRAKEPKQDIVTLRLKELTDLYYYDLSNDKRLERVRDVFCFGCFTGQRWSDITAFDKKQLYVDSEGVTHWRFEAYKTGKITDIPLVGFFAPALEILKKYDYKLPEISSQKFNKYIKEVGGVVELNRQAGITRSIGRKVVNVKGTLAEAMSSHMARRTAVSLLLNEYRLTTTEVLEITGHKELKTLQKYIDSDNRTLTKTMSKTKPVEMPNDSMRVVKTG